MRYPAFVLATLVVAILVAAGTVIASSPAAEAAGNKVRKCGGGKILLKAKEQQTFFLHNKIRHNNGLKPFCIHPKLQKAARAHSKDMIRRDYFSHNTKGRNGSACDRIKRFGYRWRSCAENIAYGTGYKASPRNITREWMKSSGHRKNILNGKYREIGVGTSTRTYKGRKGVTMYTADFGVRR